MASRMIALIVRAESVGCSIQNGPEPALVSIKSKHPLFAKDVRCFVGRDDQDCPEDALAQTDRRAEPPVAAQDAHEVDERVEHLTGWCANRRLLQEDLFETGGQ